MYFSITLLLCGCALGFKLGRFMQKTYPCRETSGTEFDGGEYNIGDNHCRDHGDNRNIEGCIGDIVEGGINAFGADTEPNN